MNTYLIEVSYKGTHYQGWQVQPHTTMTVQGQLNEALTKISKSNDIHSLASGRTDTGVHALAQKVRVQIPIEIEADNLVKALNSNLPRDIRVNTAEVTTNDFHPLAKAKRKEYRYYLSTEEATPHFDEIITFLRINKDLDLESMRKGIEIFKGKRDFLNYFCVGSDVESTTREIYEVSLKSIKSNFPDEVSILEFRFVGEGFLKQMVRLMVGTLIELGKGKISLEDIENSFSLKLDRHLAPVAPPQGLFLYKVTY